MAKRRQFSEDASKRIGRVVRIVEREYGNETPNRQEKEPRRRGALLAKLNASLTYQSTGVEATVLIGAPPSRSTGTENLTVYGSLLGSSDVSIPSGATVAIDFISGYWEATSQSCT